MPSDDNSQHQAITLRGRFLSLPTLVSFGVALAFLYFLATRIDLDWTETWNRVLSTDLGLYVLALVLYYLSFGFRGARWQVLARSAGLQDIPDARMPSILRFSQLIVIGWFVNSVAWLRMGDAYRAYALSQEANRDFSWSLGTVFAERVVDMVVVLFLIVVGATLFSVTTKSGGGGYIVGAALVMAVGLATLVLIMKGYGARFARVLPGRLESAYHRFHRGTLGSLDQRRLPAIFVLGLAGWLLEAGRLYVVVQALDMSITLPHVLLVALGHAILSTVPTPGGIGAVEPGVTGLLVLDMAAQDAATITVVDRSITYVSVIVIGFVVFLLWRASRVRTQCKESDAPKAVTHVESPGDA